jgi:hypothetical protein
MGVSGAAKTFATASGGMMRVAALPFGQVAPPDFADQAQYCYRGIDTNVPEDHAVVACQQRGLRLPVRRAGKRTHLKTLPHALDNWLLDQMVEG